MHFTRRTRRALLAAALAISGVAVTVASQASANVGTSTFDGGDGNIRVDGNETDWASKVLCTGVNANGDPTPAGCNLNIGVDQPSGQGDNSFTQGSKEDDVNVVIGLGSIPNSKADLGKFAVSSETLPNGNVMMYLAWTRNNLSGTTNFDFEINQHAQPDMTIAPGQPDRAVTLDRVGDGDGPLVDDLLINYDLPPGGSPIPVLSLRKWTGTAWSTPTPLAGFSEGRVNTGAANAIPANESGAFGQAIAAAAFGEAAIDLTAAGIIPNQNTSTECIAFGSAYVKSRSSSSFPAQMKDYIAPIGIGLDTCASLTIVKQTTPDGDPQEFNFNRSYAADVVLSDGEDDGGTTLAPGNYTISEDAVEGWTLDSATCDDGTDLVATSGVVNLGANEDVICTFNNEGLGTIIIEKQTDPDGSSQSFEFDSSYGDNFFLTDGQQNSTGDLAAGTYSVAEVNVPAGWDADGDPICDDGSFASAIDLSPGETVTCVFGNTEDSNIIVRKVIQGPTPGPTAFGITASYDADGFTLVAPPVNVGDDVNDSGDLAAGEYSVEETGIPANWAEVSTVCTSEDATSEDPSAIDLTAGETVVCVITNEWQVGAVRVTKTAKHAASETGTIPLEGVVFQVVDENGVTFNMPPTDANGETCVDSFGFQTLQSITEVSAPAGYAAGAVVEDVVIDSVAYCNGAYGGTAVDVPVSNTPLTNVTVSVDSQIDGGTASVVECVDTDGDVVPALSGSTDAVGDVSLTGLDLLPTDPAVTLTCTITIDP